MIICRGCGHEKSEHLEDVGCGHAESVGDWGERNLECACEIPRDLVEVVNAFIEAEIAKRKR